MWCFFRLFYFFLPGVEAAALARAPLPLAAVARAPLWLDVGFGHVIHQILQTLEQQVALESSTEREDGG